MSPETKVYDAKMQKTIEVVKANFASVRAGRANAGVLDRIFVEYYGTPTPLNQVAAISSPDPRTLMIQPGTAPCSRRSRRPSRPLTWASIPRTTAE